MFKVDEGMGVDEGQDSIENLKNVKCKETWFRRHPRRCIILH